MAENDHNEKRAFDDFLEATEMYNNDPKILRMVAEAKIEAEAKEKLIHVKRLLKQSLNPETYASIQIFKLFKDGRMHSWREVEEVADVSKFTVNKKLKELTKASVLKRYVIASFPPRTNYELNKEGPDPIVYKFLVSIGESLETVEKYAKLLLERYIALTKINEFDIETTEKAIQGWLKDTLVQLREDVYAPLLQTSHESWHALLATHRTYILMFFYWTIVEILTLDPRIRASAENVLKIVSDSLTKEETIAAQKQNK